ncbi:hypothetical protein [Vibrio sp. VB16]|uniref:hypothetical protein n=1 Tax=Vibrio sp. VB16 TaxID=2785746 RepID=UPI001E456992|nr:hypothetical protein [Vibrio sp. VB16]UGA53822.1 hypothetical protein IUZ65_011015 [Vibrio sp. VB16]
MSEGLKFYAYVILENHLHLVVQSEHLSRDIARFKSYTAKELILYLTEHNVRTILDEMMYQKVDYIHQNPVKRGYIDYASHWRYSSARDYEGESGLIDICRSW